MSDIMRDCADDFDCNLCRGCDEPSMLFIALTTLAFGVLLICGMGMIPFARLIGWFRGKED